MNKEKKYSLEIYEQKDFFENKEKIDKVLTEFYSDNNDIYFQNKGCVRNNNVIDSTFFYTSFKDSKLYVMRDKSDKIIAISICSQSADKLHWIINHISTAKEYRGQGYASMMMIELARDLQKSGVKTLNDEVNVYDTVALHLYNSFSRTNKVDVNRYVYKDRIQYEFNISRINDVVFISDDNFTL